MLPCLDEPAYRAVFNLAVEVHPHFITLQIPLSSERGTARKGDSLIGLLGVLVLSSSAVLSLRTTWKCCCTCQKFGDLQRVCITLHPAPLCDLCYSSRVHAPPTIQCVQY